MYNLYLFALPPSALCDCHLQQKIALSHPFFFLASCFSDMYNKRYKICKTKYIYVRKEAIGMSAGNSLKIAICDDEREIRNYMERNIRLLYADAEIISFENGQALLSYADNIDILFLDIRMEQMDGIEAARELRRADNRVTIIFVTAIEEYVFQAFDVHAFHYLLKPIEPAKFFEVLQNAVEDKKSVKRLEKKEEASIAIKKGTMTRRIFLCDILYLEVFNRTITLHTVNEDIEFYGKLVELEKCLGSDFVRCHRAFIVNLRYVQKYDAGSITLDNGASILLAKRKYADFVKRYLQYTSRLATQ